MDSKVVQWVTRSTPLESRGAWKRFVQERKGFDEGGLATPKRGLVDGPGSYSYEESGAADDFDGQRTYTDKKTGKRYRTEEFKAHLRSKTPGRSYKYPDYEGTKYIKVDGKNVKTKDYQTFLYEKDKAAGKYKSKWKNLPENVKKERIQKSLDWQKTEEGKKIRAERFKTKKLAKDPLSAVDKKVLDRFRLNLKYSKIVNDIIKDHGGMRPNPENLSELIHIHFEVDPDFQNAWKKVNGDKPFTPKNLTPAGFKNTYDRAMKGTTRVTADNFKKEIEKLFRQEVEGTGTTYDEFMENGLRFNETYLNDNYKSKTKSAQYQRRYKKILKGMPGWDPEGKGSWAWFANPEQKGATIPTILNKRLKTSAKGEAGQFVRAHYFGNIQAKKLYDLGLLDEDAAKNWKERYTWKPQYINDLQSMTYDSDVYKALIKYNKHKDKSLLAEELSSAATKAKNLGLDIDELVYNNKTGKFNFIDKGRVLQKGGDRELRYLAKNAVKEIANIENLTHKEIRAPSISQIREDYGKRANRIIKKMQVGIDYKYPKLDEKIVKAIQRVDTSEIYKIYQEAGIGTNCSIKPAKKAEGGRIGFKNAGLVDDDCMKDAIEKNRTDLKSNDPVVAAKARKSMLKVADAGKKSKTLGTLMRMGNKGRKILSAALTGGGQLLALPGMRGPTSFLAGAALEYALEAGTYDWYMRKGYTHDEALAETFLPKVVAKKFGVEKTGTGSFEDTVEYIEDKVAGTESASQRYLKNKRELEDLLVKQEQLTDSISQVEAGDPRIRLDSAEGLKDQLSGVNKRVTELYNKTKPGTPDYQSFMTRREKRDWEEGTRAREYAKSGPFNKFGLKLFADRDFEEEQKKSYYDYQGVKPASPLYRNPLDDKLKEDPLYRLKDSILGIPRLTYVGTGYGSEKEVYDNYKDIYGEMAATPYFRDKLQEQYLRDKIAAAGGVANMAGGGIAGIRRPHAIPPKSGPMPQGGGLSSMFNRVRKW